MNTYEHLIEVIDTDGSSFYAIKPGCSHEDLTREEKIMMGFGPYHNVTRKTRIDPPNAFMDFVREHISGEINLNVFGDALYDYLKKE